MVKTGSYYFLSRPRRFERASSSLPWKLTFQGKKELFEGLVNGEAGKDWIRYPVLHLDLNIEKYDTRRVWIRFCMIIWMPNHEFAEAREGVSYDKSL